MVFFPKNNVVFKKANLGYHSWIWKLGVRWEINLKSLSASQLEERWHFQEATNERELHFVCGICHSDFQHEREVCEEKKNPLAELTAEFVPFFHLLLLHVLNRAKFLWVVAFIKPRSITQPVGVYQSHRSRWQSKLRSDSMVLSASLPFPPAFHFLLHSLWWWCQPRKMIYMR